MRQMLLNKYSTSVMSFLIMYVLKKNSNKCSVLVLRVNETLPKIYPETTGTSSGNTSALFAGMFSEEDKKHSSLTLLSGSEVSSVFQRSTT